MQERLYGGLLDELNGGSEMDPAKVTRLERRMERLNEGTGPNTRAARGDER